MTVQAVLFDWGGPLSDHRPAGPPGMGGRVASPVQAVLFGWGGTLSTYVPVDLLDMWRAAARVLSPDDPEPVAAALPAPEQRGGRGRGGVGGPRRRGARAG